MNERKTIFVHGNRVIIDDRATADQLRYFPEVEPDTVPVYRQDGEVVQVPDDEPLIDHVPNDAEITYRSAPPQPASPSSKNENTKIVYLDGDPIVIDENTTANDLKTLAGVDADDLLVYFKNDHIFAFDNHERIYEHLEDGHHVSFQPTPP